ncbi:hypothetical protein ACFLV6_03515 [Chloroflexota bacterium]
MKTNTWELVNPEGVVQIEQNKVNPHPKELTGKTLLLHWNGKHNGDIFLNRIGDLFNEKIKDLKIIKGWEAIPDTKQTSQNQERSKITSQKLASLKPDIVIFATAD